MKKIQKLTAVLFVLAFITALTGCNLLGSLLPNVINSNLHGNSWTIQATGTGHTEKSLSFTAAQLAKLEADIQFVGGSAKLIMTQGGFSRTTKLHGAGISTGTISINTTGFMPDSQIVMRVEVSKITGGQTTISW